VSAVNEFNDWQIRAVPRRPRGNASSHGEPREALGHMGAMARRPDINELVDKTRNAVDRTARAYGRP